jgi:DNA repair exonuclease SbcCD ATPase subunit
MALSQPALRSSQPHIHLKGEQCPVCDQPIPNEKAEQVRFRMEARDRELSDSVGARLKEQFASERVQFEANARVVTDRLTREHAAAASRWSRKCCEMPSCSRIASA